MEEQRIAPVFDVRDDAIAAVAHRVSAVVGCRLWVRRPIAILGVEHKAQYVFVLASCPADVDAPERGGSAVCQRSPLGTLTDDVSVPLAASLPLGETQTCPYLETLTHALFLVGVDSIATLCP